MKMNYGETLKFSTLTDDGGAAGVPEEAAAPEAAAPAGESAAPAINIPENWKDALPEEFRNEPSMGVINDIQSLAKSYIHAQKQIGSDRVVVPGKHATPDDWKSLYHKLGHPDALEKYEINAPENSNFNDGFITEIKKVAFENNIMPGQLTNLLNWYSEANDKAIAEEDQRVAHEVEERMNAFKQEMGAEFNTKVNQASSAFKHLFGEDQNLFSWVEESGLGDDPNFIKMFMKISGLLQEDQIVGADSTPGANVKGVDDQLNSIMGDINGPYYNNSHPNHAAAVREVQKLLQQKHPNPS